MVERLANLAAVCGTEEAVRLARASEQALDELEALESNGLDFDLRRDGWLWTATTPSQLGAWEEVVARAERHGGRPYRPLTAEEVAERTGSPSISAASGNRLAAPSSRRSSRAASADWRWRPA